MSTQLPDSMTELKDLCSWRIGGKARVAFPAAPQDLKNLIAEAAAAGLKTRFFGWGTNLLFADQPGADELFVSTRRLTGFEIDGQGFYTGAGFPLTVMAAVGAILGDERYHYGFLLPGSTGGAIYINARCYEADTAAVISQIDYLDLSSGNADAKRIAGTECAFGYKESVFQTNPWLITGGLFGLKKPPASHQVSQARKLVDYWREADPDLSELTSFYRFSAGLKTVFQSLGAPWPAEFDRIAQDRTSKEHFTWPSSGSVFKNDRAMGKPTGALVDALGLKGMKIGGACVSPCHGNIIINSGNASAQDVKKLIAELEKAMKAAYGSSPEPEVVIY